MDRGASRRMFRAVACTVVPEAQGLGEDDWREVDAIIGRALERRPPAIARQLRTLLRVIDLRARLRYGRAFHALPYERRYALLHAFERSRVALLRKGVWGLRTLILMGYYARPVAATAIGYDAHARGWLARSDSR